MTSATDDVDAEVARVLRSRNCFDLMGVPVAVAVDDAAVKSAFRKISMLIHPDKATSNARATEAFQALQAAKDVLLDAQKREAHVKEAQKGPPPSAAAVRKEGVAPTAPADAWSFNTFDYAKMMKEREAREKEAEERRKVAEAAKQARWRAMEEAHRQEEEAARQRRDRFEERQRRFLDPMEEVKRRLNKAEDGEGSAPAAATLHLCDSRLAHTMERLASETKRAMAARSASTSSAASSSSGDASGETRARKRRASSDDARVSAGKRRKVDADDAREAEGGGDGSDSSSSSSSRERRKKRRKEKKKEKKAKARKKEKKGKKAGKEDKLAKLRAERLMREAGESLRQGEIWKS